MGLLLRLYLAFVHHQVFARDAAVKAREVPTQEALNRLVYVSSAQGQCPVRAWGDGYVAGVELLRPGLTRLIRNGVVVVYVLGR